MNSDVAISLQNVSKSFKRYARPSDRLKELLLPSKNYAQEFSALRDVSFEINRGETVGIIGRNGAGKSTLLQIICGTLTPTDGQVQVNGRVAALLELGAGFNPEFTGHDNVYMNGAIMGLSREEVDERFEAVAAFADIGDFIHQPVKTYSSGMYVRLAFAAAIHVNPDILIVDEALAVGDMFFQARCMARMRQMIDSGVTVLFVSHDTGAIKSLCQTCVFLERGQVQRVGKASEVVASYIGMVHGEMNHALRSETDTLVREDASISPSSPAIRVSHRRFDTSDSAPFSLSNGSITDVVVQTHEEATLNPDAKRYGEGGARVLDVQLLNAQRIPVKSLEMKEDFIIQASLRFEKSLPTFCFGYLIRDLKGIDLIGTVTSIERVELPEIEAGDQYIVEMQVNNVLNAGVYTLTFALEQPIRLNQQHIYLDWINDAIIFEVSPASDPLDCFTSRVYMPAKVRYAKLQNHRELAAFES